MEAKNMVGNIGKIMQNCEAWRIIVEEWRKNCGSWWIVVENVDLE